MDDGVLTLQVKRMTSSNRFCWIILERRTQDEAIEIAASLWTYDRPSEAYQAGEAVLKNSADAFRVLGLPFNPDELTPTG
ncbi:hypothetical protein ACSFBM_28245 [Variovorax sp. GB1R11]|uniref:hypothetical protein n=1 Tax=Variovorax sp. GB1R11 TaxID=3443741 RepID=UPI003F47BCA5